MKMRASRTVVACLHALVALACAAPPVAHAANDNALHVASMTPGNPDEGNAGHDTPPARQRRMDAAATTPPDRARRQASPAASADPPSCHARPVMTMCRGLQSSDAKQRCMRCLDQ
ncbi:lytic transglycosylase [Burkholderia lata]|uniref:Lytic transglycosylase n=1 Tax=Burkholderia lata (strain ATCC 17760 / DSM 23089 / LMG 22485 / NCIMB 9086 / R18194 / 383) TaxID=482957 RepID=A0A6P2JCA9_BURL3|nr:lytic transglycosylase [Burkholderia lata]